MTKITHKIRLGQSVGTLPISRRALHRDRVIRSIVEDDRREKVLVRLALRRAGHIDIDRIVSRGEPIFR